MGYAGLRMTADDFLALGETFERYELIDGVVVLSPSPRPWHNEIAAEISFQLKAFARKSRTIRVFPETDLHISSARVYRPDLSVYLAAQLPVRVGRLVLPPSLAVEVLSPGSEPLDYITKRDDYETFGVGEYWVVDPADGSIRSWRRLDARLVEVKVGGDSLASTAVPGFVLELPPIRELSAGE